MISAAVCHSLNIRTPPAARRALEKVLQNLRVWMWLRGVIDFGGSKKEPAFSKRR